MREAFDALLPDFGDDAGKGLPGRPVTEPDGAFVPFLGGRQPAMPFNELGGDAVEPGVPHGEMSGPGLHGDAAALQSLLSDVFAPEAADLAPVADPDAEQAAQPPEDTKPADGSDIAVASAGPDLELAARDERIAQLTAQIDAMQSAHEAEIARLVEQAVPAMADGVTAAVRSTLGAVLAHPLMAVIEARAVDCFCAELAAMMKAGEGVSVRLSGPESLLESVRARWPDTLAAPQMEVADTADLVAIADTAVLSTRLEEAAALLSGGGR